MIFQVSLVFLVIATVNSQFPAGGISHVQDAGKHNQIVKLCRQHIGKLEGANWEIVEIRSTKSQVVGGMKYYCEGRFRDRADNSLYDAVVTVYERSWENFVQVGVDEKTKVY